MKTYPEHEKLNKVKNTSQEIGGFLEWLLGTKNFHLMEYVDSKEREIPEYIHKKTGEERNSTDFYNCRDKSIIKNPDYVPTGYYNVRIGTEKLLAEYFEIDLIKLEKEKIDMLKCLRETNEKR